MGSAGIRQTVYQTSFDHRAYLQADLPKFILADRIGNGKCTKSYTMKVDGVMVVVKVYMKPADEDITIHVVNLTEAWKKLSPVKYPNLLPTQMWLKSSTKTPRHGLTPVYLIRQYFSSNLYDRLSTRPFLTSLEKLWIVYQLFMALESAHQEGIMHGDIRPENIMVTTWNWVVLTDFAVYKPLVIPDDDPTDFQYFFDVMDRRRCYVAPERFVRSRVALGDTMTCPDLGDEISFDMPAKCAMDVFSLGCTIAEILLDGEPLLDLPSMLQYIQLGKDSGSFLISKLDDEGSPVASIMNRITDARLRMIISSMTQRDPLHRRSVASNRYKLEEMGVFPAYFRDMYSLFLNVHYNGTTPENRINIISQNYGDIMRSVACISDEEGAEFFEKSLSTDNLMHTEKIDFSAISGQKLRAGERIGKDYAQSSMDSLLSSFNQLFENRSGDLQAKDVSAVNIGKSTEASAAPLKHYRDCVPFSIENVFRVDQSVGKSSLGPVTSVMPFDKRDNCNGLLLAVQLVCSNMRSLRYPHSKIVSMMLLLRLGLLCSNDIVIRRIVPYVVSLLEDNVAIVRAISIRTLRNLLMALDHVSSIDANIFELHLFSSLGRMTKDTESIVRVIFAESIGRFAEVSKKFLDLARYDMQRNTNSPEKSKDTGVQNATTIDEQYDYRLKSLHDQCSRWIRDVILDSSFSINVERKVSAISASSPLKRILLVDVVRLCSFFSSHDSVVFFVTQLLTYLNEQDWEVRCEFCSKLPSLCSILGPTILPLDCILPSIEKYIYDSQEMVVTSAIACLVKLTELNLLPLHYIVTTLEKTVMLVLHPSDAIRASVIDLIVGSGKHLGASDAYVHILALLQPVIRNTVVGFELNAAILRDALISPVSRTVYEQLILDCRAKLLTVVPSSQVNNGMPSQGEESSVDASTVVIHSRVSPGSTPGKNDSHALSMNSRYESVKENATGCNFKITYIQRYVELVAKELHKKTAQYRQDNRLNASSTTASRRQSMGVPGPVSATSHVDSVFDYSDISFTTFTNLVQHFVVPSQKNSLKNFASEEVRKCSLTSTDVDKVKEAYGVSINSADIARTLALGENATDSQRYATTKISEAVGDPHGIIRKIKSIPLPPVSPDLGCLIQPTDGRKYSMYFENLDQPISHEGQTSYQWRPRENIIVTLMREHTQSVNRLCVSQDQTFFASASSDKTIKIWQVKGLERNATPKSSMTYVKHTAPVTDITMIENSHSIASCSDSGEIHIWRVDIGMASSPPAGTTINTDVLPVYRYASTSVSGATTIKTFDIGDGPIASLQHFNSDISSLLVYATHRGSVRMWDLRSEKEPMGFSLQSELGYPVSMTTSTDRNFICVGTSEGYIALWDIRYNTLSQLWRHSSCGPIYRLACCKSSSLKPKNDALPPADGAYLFVAAGSNEASVFGIPEGGECLKCFRSRPMLATRDLSSPLPKMCEIPISSRTHQPLKLEFNRGKRSEGHSVRTLMGKVSQSGASFLVSAGTDMRIRYWDFSSSNKCFTVSGLDRSQPKSVYEMPQSGPSKNKLISCYDSSIPTQDTTLQSHVPLRYGRGPISFEPCIEVKIFDMIVVTHPGCHNRLKKHRITRKNDDFKFTRWCN